MAKRKNLYIAVVGGGSATPETAALAQRVGELIAKSGAVLICGGLGGVMEAACRGAKNRGGTTIGILPGADHRQANDYVDHAICTATGEARNLAVVLTADGIIALPGEFGTLSEISFALKHDKPVVSLSSWAVSERIVSVETPDEAVEQIMERAKPW